MSYVVPVVYLYLDGPDATATDITAYVRDVEVRRGRSRELDTFPVGTATVTVQNNDRRFDPTNPAGPYFGRLRPRLRIAVISDGVSLFDGWVEDLDYAYDPSGWSEVTIKCVDGLAKLGQATLSAYTNVQQTASQRITAVLARPEVGYTGTVALDPGLNILQADSVADATNVLNYLQEVARTDFGRLFVDGSGVLRFRDRTTGVLNSASVVFGVSDDRLVAQLATLSSSTLWFDALAPEPLRTDADALAQVILQDATLWFDARDPAYVAPLVPFNGVDLVYGSEYLYNRVTVTRNGGVAQNAVDVDSINLFGVRALAESGLLFLSDSDSAAFGSFLLTQYAGPAVRVATHTLLLHGLDPVHTRYVMRLEIGDVVRTVWTPGGTGVGMDIKSFVEGIEHRITPSEHEMVLQLTPLENAGGFILDDANRGLLDSSEVTY